MGKKSQYQNIRVLLEYQDSHLTNAKCRLASSFAQLQLQKTKLQHNSTLQLALRSFRPFGQLGD